MSEFDKWIVDYNKETDNRIRLGLNDAPMTMTKAFDVTKNMMSIKKNVFSKKEWDDLRGYGLVAVESVGEMSLFGKKIL